MLSLNRKNITFPVFDDSFRDPGLIRPRGSIQDKVVTESLIKALLCIQNKIFTM